MACGVASMPSAERAAEPGTTLMATNSTSDAASSVGTKARRRKATSRSMPAPPRPASGLEPGVLQGLQEARPHRLVVLQLLGVGDQQPAVDQRHLAHLLERELLHLSVDRLTLVLSRRGLGLLEDVVHRLAAVLLDVDRHPALVVVADEIVRVGKRREPVHRGDV